MRFAYADPPYIGQAKKHYAAEARARGAEAAEVDQHALIQQLTTEYPDGWALSMGSKDLRALLPLCPPRARVLAWVKPWAQFHKHVPLVYAWEPVILMGGRRGPTTRYEHFTLDWHLASRNREQPKQNNTATGAKPITFCLWLLQCLGYGPEDEIVDLFPGTGTMGLAVRVFTAQARLSL